MDQHQGQAEQQATGRHDALPFYAVLGFILATLPLLGVPLLLRLLPVLALSSVAAALLAAANMVGRFGADDERPALAGHRDPAQPPLPLDNSS